MAVPGPYIGSMTPAQRAAMGTGKDLTRYYTYRAGKKGRKDNNVLKLAANQIARFKEGRGWYAAPKPAGGGGPPPPAGGGGGAPSGGSGARDMANSSLEDFIAMLAEKQNAALEAQLNDSRRRSLAHVSALGGFGTSLQSFAKEQWDAANLGYQNMAGQQTDMAQGLGQQVGNQVAQQAANQQALAEQLHYTGGTTLPTAEAAQAQIASEGGAKTGEMMSAVGKAWGGYGATRPDYLGFMTGHQQMQLAGEQIEQERDLRSKYLELAMDNPKTALEMWTAIQENKRQNVSTSLAQQTLRQNIAMQKAKLKQQYAEMRADAKTAAQKANLDRWYKEQTLTLKQQELAIDQQNANSRTETAAAATTRANRPPSPGKGPAYSTGTYAQKVAAAMKNVPTLFNQSGAGKKGKNRVNYAFGILWPQMAPYVSAANQARAKDLLRKQIQAAARGYTPDKSDSGGFGQFAG